MMGYSGVTIAKKGWSHATTSYANCSSSTTSSTIWPIKSLGCMTCLKANQPSTTTNNIWLYCRFESSIMQFKQQIHTINCLSLLCNCRSDNSKWNGASLMCILNYRIVENPVKYFSMNIYMTTNENDEVENMCSNSQNSGATIISAVLDANQSEYRK